MQDGGPCAAADIERVIEVAECVDFAEDRQRAFDQPVGSAKRRNVELGGE